MPQPLVANLVCGSPWRNHDYDDARLRLGQILYDLNDIRTDCWQDFEDSACIAGGDLLVTYTSQLAVTEKAATTLRRWLEKGGRWFAMHSSNSVAGNMAMAQLIGSQFIDHPPYHEFTVTVAKPDEPLLEGISEFAVTDELHCFEPATNDIEVLLSSRWGGKGILGNMHEVQDRPVLYRRKIGDQGGGVLWLGLGHANRPYDKPRPHLPDQPDYRGPWGSEPFDTIVRRGCEWAAGRRPF